MSDDQNSSNSAKENLITIGNHEVFLDQDQQVWGREKPWHLEAGMVNALTNFLEKHGFSPRRNISLFKEFDFGDRSASLWNYDLRHDLTYEVGKNEIFSFQKKGRTEIRLTFEMDEVPEMLRLTFQKYLQWSKCHKFGAYHLDAFPRIQLGFPVYQFLDPKEEKALWKDINTYSSVSSGDGKGRGRTVEMKIPLILLPFDEEGKALENINQQTINQWVYRFYESNGVPRKKHAFIVALQSESTSYGDLYGFFYGSLLPSGKNGSIEFLAFDDLVEKEAFWACVFPPGKHKRAASKDAPGTGLGFEEYTKRGFDLG